MQIELATSAETNSFEVLDVQVQTRPDRSSPEAGRSLLSVRFVGRRNREDNHLKMPPLTWYDANQLQQFTRQLTTDAYLEQYQIDLPDAGMRLTSFGETDRSIRVEPLPTSQRRFVPFVINGTVGSLRRYGRILYQRLWEAFCRG